MNDLLNRAWFVLLSLLSGLAGASAATIPAAPPGQVETGTPAFAIMGRGELGLIAQPTDIHRLPDGTMLIVAGRQLAVGDGARWNTYPQADDDPSVPTRTVAVDAAGGIYAGVPGGFARVHFDDTGAWRLVRQADMPNNARDPTRVPREVEVVGTSWYWHAGSGEVDLWRPGATAVVAGSTGAIEHVFEFKRRHYLTDRSDGWIFRRDGPKFVLLPSAGAATPAQAVICSAPLDDGAMLAGTHARGLMLFDGENLRPWIAGPPLAGGSRINDLCRTGDGQFVAAVDNIGLVHFDARGRVRQIVGRSLDTRLARVQKLVVGADGGLWGLLNDGILRVEAPTRFSSFDLLIGSSVNTAFPVRFQERLWLLADGVVLQGIYDGAGRLERLEQNSPAGRFVFALNADTGVLLAGTDAGLFSYTTDGWRCVEPEIVNVRILPGRPRDGRWLYGARGELGWLRPVAGGVALERHPIAGLGDIYGGETGADGVPWLELGTGMLGRVKLSPDGLALDRFDVEDGLPNSWAQTFLVDGVVRFNVGESILAFDAATGRFVPESGFLRGLPDVAPIIGRPCRDTLGRLWVAGNGRLLVIDDQHGPPRILDENPPASASPNLFTCEDGGVVWMHDQHRLLRYDPAEPNPPRPPLRAEITRVSLPESGRVLFPSGGSVGSLGERDHSVAINFLAPGDSVSTPATFEVRLEGSDKGWTNMGPGGAAVFSRLREGAYTFLVRPRAGARTGAEASLTFTIQPPWYRSGAAYTSYAAGSIALLLGVALGWSYLARRERRRLERLVGERTAELSQSEERYRRLNEELEQRVQARTAELDRANNQLQTSNMELEASNRELESFSYSVSHDLRAPLRGIDGWSLALMEDYGPLLDATALDYIERVRRESQRLGVIIDELLKLSRTSRAELRAERLDLSALAATVAARVAESRPHPRVDFICQPGLEACGDPLLIESALTNLLDNAWKFTARTTRPRVEFGRTGTDRGAAFFVRDNGAGFDMRHARKLFGAFQRMHTQQEFPGTGVGLATVQRIIRRHHGAIWAESIPAVQTTFYFTLPDRPADANP